MERELFEKLIEAQGDRIYGFCLHLCGTRDEADELFQDTMLRAFELRRKIEAHSGSEDELKRAGNYVIGISLKVNKERLRKNSREPEKLSIEENDISVYEDWQDPEQAFIEKEEIALVKKAVKLLPEKLKITVHLYYYAGLTVEEIAGVLRIPKGTVKSRLNKARKLIKESLISQHIQ